MSEEAYKKLCEEMARRGGRYPGKDIPEFYVLAEELWTPEEAAVTAVMTSRISTAVKVAASMGRDVKEIEAVLEAIADKSLCMSFDEGGTRYYISVPFAPGIFEFQFSRGGWTEKDRRVARRIHAYKEAFDRTNPPQKRTGFPLTRVVPIDETIQPESKVHTFNQINSYIDKADPIGVYTCFCRHEAKLLDEKDDCGMPMEVCMMFGVGADSLSSGGLRVS